MDGCGFSFKKRGGGGGTQPFPTDEGAEKLNGDPKTGPNLKVFTSGQTTAGLKAKVAEKAVVFSVVNIVAKFR